MRYTYKYGIDFGTTNSSIALRFMGTDNNEHTYVARLKDTKPQEVMPSVVLFDKKGRKRAGQEAKEYYLQKQYSSQELKFIKKIKLDLENEGTELKYTLGGTTVSGVDLIASMLKTLKVKADKEVAIRCGVPVEAISGVVMGVPVQYGDVQKDVLKKALCKAGFYKNIEEADKCTEFVSEPIAVAVHNGLNLSQDRTVMVFDFGGGTLDLAVVNLKHQVGKDVLHPHETKAKERMTLGGEELTKLFFVNCFCSERKYGTTRLANAFKLKGIYSPEKLWNKLLEVPAGIRFIDRIEECKCDLSTSYRSEFYFTDVNVQVKPMDFYQDDFRDAIIDKLDEIDEFIELTLENAGISDKYDIDRVILAGGSSMIPSVQDVLVSKFGNRKVSSKINDDDEYIKKLKGVKVSENEVLTSIVRGLAMVGFRKEELIEDVVDSDYGVWDDVENDLIVIIPKGIPVKETRLNKISQEGKCEEVQCVDKNALSLEVSVYQRVYKNGAEATQQLGRINFQKMSGGASYRIFMEVDKKKGSLKVHIYDVNRNRWIEEIPLQQRTFNLI